VPAPSSVAFTEVDSRGMQVGGIRHVTAAAGLRRTSPTEWHLLTRGVVTRRSHHEELAAATSVVPALSTLVPFAVALWMRIRHTRVADIPPRKEDA
jgi:hypothetical protein